MDLYSHFINKRLRILFTKEQTTNPFIVFLLRYYNQEQFKRLDQISFLPYTLFQMCMESSALHPEDWSFLGQGQQHCVLSYSGPNAAFRRKVLILEKSDASYPYLRSVSQLPQQTVLNLSKICFDMLHSFKPMNPYLMKWHKIDVDQKKKEQFLRDLMQRIKFSRRQNQRNVPVLNWKDMILADNLYTLRNHPKIKSTIFLEFKPKTCLYDQYTTETVKSVADKFQMKLKEFIELIQNRPQIEKTKLFKKNLTEKNPLHKFNPMKMFECTCANFLRDVVMTKIFPVGSVLPISSEEMDQIINDLLKKTRVLDMILCLHMLYYKPFELLSITSQQFCTLLNESTPESLSTRLANELSNLYLNFQPGSYVRSLIYDSPVQASDLVYQTIKCLITSTWRDISIIVEVNVLEIGEEVGSIVEEGMVVKDVNQKYQSVSKVTVIDFDVKPFNRVKGLADRDKVYLEEYVKMKSLI